MDTKDAIRNIIGNRLVVSYELIKDQMKKGSFCESEEWMMQSDPRNYTQSSWDNYLFGNDVMDPKTAFTPHLLHLLSDF